MAQIYYPKSTSTKYLEGAVAGLAGGVVASIVVTLADALIPDRSWWTTLATVGGILTGATDFNTASPDWGSWLIGLALTLIAFALFGMGFVGYLPLIRNFNLNIFLAGVLYGLLLWIVIDLLILNLLTSGRLNLIILLVADLLAGMTMAWWIQWVNRPKTS
jgi:hypothetical protein